MDINSVSTQAAGVYGSVNQSAVTKPEEKEVASKADESSVVYEKSSETTDKATYSINKMSKEDRANLVQKLKEDQASREASLVDLVNQMMTKQAGTANIALAIGEKSEDDDSMWKFLASGDFTVDEATRKQAEEDISEDGYWGVKQTSQRLFDFASALAGDDEGMMKKMQSAMEEGFKQATKSWGKDLPQISQDTLSAANKLFDDYYASKSVVEA